MEEKKNCPVCENKYCANKVSIFSVLEDKELKEVTDLIIHKKYKKGQIICFEGDVSDRLYIISRGKIKVFKYTKEGKEQILYILSEGDFIGDLSLLKRSSFKFNAEALEDVAVCTLGKNDFDNVLKENPEIALKILEVVHDRIMRLEDLIQSLSTNDIEARIASLLLSFIKDFGIVEEDNIVLNIPLSREDMANYIGVTRETISRKLSSMQDEGTIELSGNKKIIIKNKENLKLLV
ncbi:Crp/Fnr family transcriptional regulator [Sporosalibacterium faouarense]|uniref:Crp/Fnr family transcriptional regulator n=1 Tax=Sporosalibacterium faouarense TaxID=516123 RepID=UPI00141CB353|nr:Crp/Fnr family transcriptional regulator [Sporosalibacterium faouarense]MTI48845.1 Crp/Fnr family transcriptional regulator [Bacillota bacterium]